MPLCERGPNSLDERKLRQAAEKKHSAGYEQEVRHVNFSSPAKRGRGTTGPKVRWWRGRKGGFHEALHHVVHSAQHIPRRDADNPVAQPRHVLIPPQISFDRAVLGVIRAIDLNDQLSGAAIEVGDVGTDRVLAAERRPNATHGAQSTPE
jgi:hypothetical protein